MTGRAAAFLVQSTQNGAVTDAGWYCAGCVVRGVRQWTSGLGEGLRLERGNVAIGDDATRCAGCGRLLGTGLGEDLMIAGDEPVGLQEIAERLEVQRRTADQWRQRGILPPPTWIVGGRPAWSWDVIERWASESGRSRTR